MAIFSLNEVRTEQIKNIANDNFESWPESATYGYFGGADTPSIASIDRIDFSNETTSAPGNNLTESRDELAAVSSSSYGYFGGGQNSAIGETIIDRIDFSNETTSAPGYNLTQARGGLAAVSSSSYGYFGGGTPSVDTIDRIDFSNETTSPVTATLPEGRYRLAALSSSSYGYFGGGIPTTTGLISRIDFSNETTSAPGNNLTQARGGLAAVSSSSYGYFGGGYAPPFSNTIDRIDFSNETTSPVTATLPQAREFLAATSSSSYGYFGGGYVGPPIDDEVATIDRIDFSNETTSAPGNNLPQARYALAAVSGGASQRIKGSRTYGYFGGGAQPNSPGVQPGKVEKLDFSTEICSLPSNQLSTERRNLAALSSSSYGYFGGGYAPRPDLSPPYNILDTIDRLDFSNETLSLPGNDLSQARSGLAAVSSSSYGYFAGGGGFSPPTGLIDRIDFSNETTSAPGNNLPLNTYNTSAVSSGSYGYFGGGVSFPPPPPTRTISATVDRLDFSSETFSAPGNNLSQARELLSAVSSSSYGYFGGGIDYNPNPYTYFDRIDRIDFSNETTSAPGNDLPEGISDSAAVSSSSYGYFAGGSVGPPIDDEVATIDRIDFSSETFSAPGNNLSQERFRFAAVSN